MVDNDFIERMRKKDEAKLIEFTEKMKKTKLEELKSRFESVLQEYEKAAIKVIDTEKTFQTLIELCTDCDYKKNKLCTEHFEINLLATKLRNTLQENLMIYAQKIGFLGELEFIEKQVNDGEYV